MSIETIMADAMQNFELVVGGVILGYAAGSLMTKRKLKRRGGMGMGGGMM